MFALKQKNRIRIEFFSRKKAIFFSICAFEKYRIFFVPICEPILLRFFPRRNINSVGKTCSLGNTRKVSRYFLYIFSRLGNT